MTIPKHRQLRGRFTGGIQDVEAFRAMLLKSVDPEEWELSFDRVDSFGEKGPIKKWTFGFTTKA